MGALKISCRNIPLNALYWEREESFWEEEEKIAWGLSLEEGGLLEFVSGVIIDRMIEATMKRGEGMGIRLQ